MMMMETTLPIRRCWNCWETIKTGHFNYIAEQFVEEMVFGIGLGLALVTQAMH
jgi:hypothetical protein